MVTVAATVLKLLVALMLLPVKMVASLASVFLYAAGALVAFVLLITVAALLPIMLPLAAIAAITAAIMA